MLQYTLIIKNNINLDTIYIIFSLQTITLLFLDVTLSSTAIDFDLDSIPTNYLDYYQSYAQCKYFAVKSNFGGAQLVLKTDDSKGYPLFSLSSNQNRNYLTACSEDKAFAGDLNSGQGQLTSFKGFYKTGKTDPQNISITMTGQVLFASGDDHFIMEIQDQNLMRIGLMYYENNQLNYKTSDEAINQANGWQFINVSIIENNQQKYIVMLAVMDDQQLTLYDFQVQNNNKTITTYSINKPKGNTIITSKTNFVSDYLVTQDENIIYFYNLIINNGQLTYKTAQNKQFDILQMYDMFNVTNNYIKPSKLMTIHRVILYSQDTLIFASSYSEYDEETNNLLAFYRILDNNLQYLWTGSNLPSHIDSDHLGQLIFQGNFDRGNQNTMEVDMDRLLDAYDLETNQQTDSCYLNEELIDTTVPINNANTDTIELKLKDTVDLSTVEDQYHCTLNHTTISYVDYYQKVNLKYDEETQKYTGQVQLKSAQLSCEFQASNYPSELNGKLISNQILAIENSINLQSCYNSAIFTADIDYNNVTFTKPSSFTPNTCQIDSPDMVATIEYEGKNYSHQMTESSTPSIQQLVSYNALFEPNLYPSFQSDNLPLYITIKSYTPSGMLLKTYEKQYTLSQDLDTCFDSQQKTWLTYYNNAFHVRNIDVLDSKYDKPCIFIYDFDIFNVKIYSEDRTGSQLFETNSWEKYDPKSDDQFKYIQPKLFQNVNMTPDMAHYYDINVHKEKISDTADFTVSIDDGDSDKIHSYNLRFLTYFQIPCIIRPDAIKMYQIDDEVYLDVSGNRNCNADLSLTMSDLTLITESEECDFESQVSSYLYKGSCFYYKNSVLKYEFSVDFTWDSYEIEEDFTMYLPVEVLDKSESSSYWEVWLTVLLVVPIGVWTVTCVLYRVKVRGQKNMRDFDSQNLSGDGKDVKMTGATGVGDMQNPTDVDQQGDKQGDLINFQEDQKGVQDDLSSDINQQSISDSQDDFYMYNSIPMPKFK